MDKTERERYRGPRTVAEFAYETVKSWILSGRLTPGGHIDQDLLASKLGLSKMPIRSALDKLAAEGLVIIHPHRGAVTSPLSLEDLKEVYLVRCHLESLAVKLATERASAEDIELLSVLVDRQETSVDSTDTDEVLAANREFHMTIYRLAGQKLLVRLIEGLWEQSERYRRIFLNQPGMIVGSINEHRRLVELIAAGRADEAADFQVKHNEKTLTVLASQIAQSNEHHGAGRG